MILQSLLEDNRLNWQKCTQEEILNNLLQKSHQYKLLGQRDEKLVMVFGKSHAGKTTLILSLMGIKEHLIKKISLVLRAGIPEGSSSTSTSIIYQESDDDRFGVLEKTINEVSTDIHKCQEEEVVDYLKKVREQVEQGKHSLDKVLYIFIPKYYFEEKRNDDSLINILDVPGFETNNEKERAHTNAILNKYMAISSLNIIIRSIYDINDLRYFVAPNRDDISKLCTSKYLIITTRSYSQENIFKYFLTPKTQRSSSFEDLIQKECHEQFKRICGERVPKVYPVDLGESFDELINNKIVDPDDRDYLISYRNKVFSDILSVIKQRQNNSLKSWVDELLEDEEFYSNKELKALKSEKEAHERSKKEKEASLVERKGFLAQIKQNLRNLEEANNSNKLKKEQIPAPIIDSIIDGCIEEIKSTNFNDNYSWKKTKISNNVADLFALAFQTEVDEYLLKLKSHDSDIYHELMKSKICSAREDQEIHLRSELDSEMNAHKLLKVLNPSNKEKVERIGRTKLEKVLGEYLNNLYNEYSSLLEKRNNQLVSNQLNSHKILKKEEEKKIKGIENEINRLAVQIDEIQTQIDEVNKRVDKDKETIQEYRDTAKKYFDIEKERIIREMNNATSSVVKLEYIILLGLMQKDYEKLAMG